jgi:hypothetical protein
MDFGEDRMTITWPRTRRHTTSPDKREIRFTDTHGDITLTIFLRYIRIGYPRRELRNIEQIPDDRPRWRPRGIRETPSPSVIIEIEEGIKKDRESEAVNHRNERDWHVLGYEKDHDLRKIRCIYMWDPA